MTSTTATATTATTTATEIATIFSPREAILHSADLLRKSITVKGTVVLADEALGRVDISHQGAKLIVRWNSKMEMPTVEQDIIITGVLKKEQRRTFLLANKFEDL